MKTILAQVPHPIYSHCAVIQAPSNLPDGDYEIEFGKEVAITHLRHGAWTVGKVLPHTLEEANTFYTSDSSDS